MLRAFGVVGAFVEFAGDGLAGLSLADRATISNMSPEFGATATLFPIDDETLAYLRLTGRPEARVDLVERYAKAQGLWREPGNGPEFDVALELDLATVEPSLAGPRRPQDRVALAGLGDNFRGAFPQTVGTQRHPIAGADDAPPFGHGSVAIAAITSCTNTSNPTVMVGAGLLARNAVARGLRVSPTVKTSLAPGSKAVTGYLERAGLMAPLGDLGFALAGLRVHDVHRQLGARSPSPSPPPSSPTSSSWRPSCRATATSRAASIPSCGPRTSRPRRSWWRSRSRAASTST